MWLTCIFALQFSYLVELSGSLALMSCCEFGIRWAETKWSTAAFSALSDCELVAISCILHASEIGFLLMSSIEDNLLEDSGCT